MLNLACFRHRKYDGTQPPVLSCKTCCKMYIDTIREEQTKATDKIIEKKKDQAVEKKRGLAGNDK